MRDSGQITDVPELHDRLIAGTAITLNCPLIYSLRMKTPPHSDPLPPMGRGQRVRGKGGFSSVTSITNGPVLNTSESVETVW